MLAVSWQAVPMSNKSMAAAAAGFFLAAFVSSSFAAGPVSHEKEIEIRRTLELPRVQKRAQNTKRKRAISEALFAGNSRAIHRSLFDVRPVSDAGSALICRDRPSTRPATMARLPQIWTECGFSFNHTAA